MRLRFRFDPNRCTGCDACRLACTIENELPLDRSWRQVLPFNPRRHPAAPAFHLSLACNHCAEPPCARACPALAYRVDDSTGAVLLDASKCIGCRYCTWACPYDAPRWDAALGVVSKCSLCIERLSRDLVPACASSCPTGALDFGPAREEELRQEVEGFPQRATMPALSIVPLRAARLGSSGPDGGSAPAPLPAEIELPASPIRISHEWPLVAFTFLASALVGVVLARALAMLARTPSIIPGGALPAGGFLLASLLALALGGAHLGRRERAWRALRNLRRSWLSREIAAMLGFTLAGTLWLGLAPESRSAGALAASCGLFLLFTIDRLYAVTARLPRPARPHSAGALLSGAFFGTVFAAWPVPALVLGACKLALYLRRGEPFAGWKWGALRVGLGFVLPALAWSALGHSAAPLAVAGVLSGEWMDRCEYYLALQFDSPQRQLVLALRARLAGSGVLPLATPPGLE